MGVETNEKATPRALTWHRVYALASGVLAAVGFAVILALALPGARDSVMRQLLWTPWKADLSAWMRPRRAAAGADGAADLSALAAGGAREPVHADPLLHAAFEDPAQGAASARARDQQAVTAFIAKRYRVADEMIARFVSVAYRASAQHGVDPLLVLAVMATESRYNPIAESVVGAKGLMQVIGKYHPEKLQEFGGENALLDPEVNIVIGTRILREYLRRYGDLETALQMYAGALDDASTQYARKVLAERGRLQQALAKLRREA